MDMLLGAHTGRALPPLATIDLVGWDVHRAIVDNLWSNTADDAHPCFELPAYVGAGIAAGRLGRKTRDVGGFFRVDGKGPTARRFVLDPATGSYVQLAPPAVPTVVAAMQDAVRAGCYAEALDVMCRAEGGDAAMMRHVMLGYVSYALGLVGEVVGQARDVDRIMGFGFNWAPPSVIVDVIGAARMAGLLEREDLPVPAVVDDAARTGAALFRESGVDPKRWYRSAVAT